MKKTKTFKLTTVAAALTTAFAPASAEEITGDLVRELTTPASSMSFGIGNWSRDRRQTGTYDGMRDGKTYGFLDLDLVKRDDATGTWLTLSGRNLGQDTREIRGEWLRQGDIGVSLGYSRLTRDNPLTFITGLQGIGTSAQTISGVGANDFPDREVSLSTTRDLVDFGFYKSFSRFVDLKISFKNEEKTGARNWGRGANAYLVTEPLDATTSQLETFLNYTADRVQVSGGYNASWYRNKFQTLATTVNGVVGTTTLSLPLDNQAHQVFVNGGYSFTPTTRGTAKISYAVATQDERLATPSDWAVMAGGPPTSLQGKVATTTAEVGLTSKPLQKLSVVANLRYHDVKDKTPVRRFTSKANGYYTPHSFTTTTGKLEGTYRLPDGYSMTAGLDHKDQDRSAPTTGELAAVTNVESPFRQKIKETTYRLQLRRALSDTVNGSLAYLHADRKGSLDVLPTVVGEVRAINPLHITDRKRDKWRGMIDWAPAERLSIQFVAENSRDKYSFRPALGAAALDTPEGLQSGGASLYSADASYTLSDDWQVTAYYAVDATKAKLSGRGTTAANQKLTDIKETGDSFGAGLKGQISAKLKLGADLEWVKSVTEYRQSGPGVVAFSANYTTVLPDVTNMMTRLKLFTEYDLAKNSSLRFDFIHERWRTDDWTWTFSNGSPFVYNGTTAATDGTTVIANRKHVSNFIGARYVYKFQ